MFQPVSDNIALSRKIVSQITDKIVRGELHAGDRIPPERELATMFGVSRTAIRDAIKILSGRGVLRVRHGVGIFVAEEQPTDVPTVDFYSAKLRDLFEIRQTLEPQAAAWAAKRRSEEHCVRLRKIVDDAKAHTDNLSVLAERDAQFHVAIAEASQNILLVKVMWTLLDTLAEVRTTSLQIPNRPIASLAEHDKILSAIEQQEDSQAYMFMQLHLSSVEQEIVRSGFPNNPPNNPSEK